MDGQGLSEMLNGGLHPAVDGQGLSERSSGGLHPAECSGWTRLM